MKIDGIKLAKTSKVNIFAKSKFTKVTLFKTKFLSFEIKQIFN